MKDNIINVVKDYIKDYTIDIIRNNILLRVILKIMSINNVKNSNINDVYDNVKDDVNI